MLAIVCWMSCLPKLTDGLMQAMPYLTNESREKALHELSGSRGHQRMHPEEGNNDMTDDMDFGFDDEDDD